LDASTGAVDSPGVQSRGLCYIRPVIPAARCITSRVNEALSVIWSADHRSRRRRKTIFRRRTRIDSGHFWNLRYSL